MYSKKAIDKYDESENAILTQGSLSSNDTDGGTPRRAPTSSWPVQRSDDDLGADYNSVSFSFKVIGIIAFVLFPFIGVISLFAITGDLQKSVNDLNAQSGTTTTPSNTIVGSFPFIITPKSSLQTTPAAMNSILTNPSDNRDRPGSTQTLGPAPVSLTFFGSVRLGAGTSLYTFPSSPVITQTCPSYLDVDAIYNDRYLVSFADKNTGSASISVVATDLTTSQPTTLSTTAIDAPLSQVTTLNQATGLFVYISGDTSSSADTAIIAAGLVDGSNTAQIRLGPTNTTFIGNSNYTVGPQIIALSEDTFAVTYFLYSPIATLMTRVGTVNPTTLTVTLSEEMTLIPQADYLINTVTGLGSSSYLVSYYIQDSATLQGSLQSVVVTITNPTDPIASAELAVSPAATLESSSCASFLASTRVSDTTAIVSFADASNNYGIRSVVVTLVQTTGTNSFTVFYGSSLQVTTGQSLKTLPEYVLMDIDMTTVFSDYTVSTSGSIAGSGSATTTVVFSDVTNGGAMTAINLLLTSSGTLVRSSPNWVFTAGNANLDTMYSWTGVSANSATSSLYGSQLMIVTSLSDLDCTNSPASTSVSVMNFLASPVGTVISSSLLTEDKDAVLVSVQGPIDGFTGLTVGMPYYATTQGAIIPGQSFYGQGLTGAGAGTCSAEDYIVTAGASGGNIVQVSAAASYVGLAITPTTILLGK